METMSLKLDDDFATDIETTRKRYHYTTKTEFVREAIRDKIKNLEVEESLKLLRKMYGASKRKTTVAQLHAAREKAARELLNELS